VAALADAGEHDAVVVDLLVDGGARVPNLRVRAGRQRREQRAERGLRQLHRLVEDHAVAAEAAAAALRPGAEPDALAALEGDALLAVGARDALHALVEVRGLLDQLQQPAERLQRRVELVRRVGDELLAEQEQPAELARLEDAALAVLALAPRPTSNAAHWPSTRSPSARSSTNCCHGSSSSPASARAR
jgi:hypothetical protein